MFSVFLKGQMVIFMNPYISLKGARVFSKMGFSNSRPIILKKKSNLKKVEPLVIFGKDNEFS